MSPLERSSQTPWLRSVLASLAVGSSLVAGGCFGGGSVSPTVSEPEARTTVLAEDDAPALAVAASRALYDEAPVVVLAADGAPESQARAASVAVGFGAPLLLTPDGDASGDGLAQELDRLSTDSVLAADAAAARWAADREVDVVPAPGAAEDLAEMTRVSPSDPKAVAPAQLTREVAGLSRSDTRLLDLRGAEPSPAGRSAEQSDDDELPEHEPAAPLEGLTVITSPSRRNVAATATARAAGARVVIATDGDPRADPAAIAALSEKAPEKVLGMGGAMGDDERLRARIEVAATGVELPGGGQVLFPHRRMVSLYGHPDGGALGVLGEQPLDEAIQRAERVAREYDPHSEIPVIPAFEIIATIASSSPGEDGNYSIRTEVRRLRRWVDAAGEAGMYVVLDLQPGRTDFLTQARHYEELLREPHVGLALDPEWRLKPGEVHLNQIGSVGVDEVNSVATWLAELTRKERLPQKLLLLHQFQLAMIADRDRLDTSHDELAVLIHADGHGARDLKQATWQTLTEDAPDDVWWGWKNFYDEDMPTWTPQETTALEPSVMFVSYQ